MISHALQSVQSPRSPTDVLAVNCFYMAVCVVNSYVYIYYNSNFSTVCPSIFLPKLETQCCQGEVIKLLLIADSSFGVGAAGLQGGDKIIIR